VKRLSLLAVVGTMATSALAYTDLPWKFEGNTDRTPTSIQSKACEELDSFAYSIGKSSPMWYFSTFNRGMIVVAF